MRALAHGVGYSEKVWTDENQSLKFMLKYVRTVRYVKANKHVERSNMSKVKKGVTRLNAIEGRK